MGEGKLTKRNHVTGYRFINVALSPIKDCDPNMRFIVDERED